MPKEFELKCPNCGNDGRSSDSEKQIQHLEWIPVFRTVEGVVGKTVFLDFDNYQDIPEEAKDPHFFCLMCKHEWPAVDGLTMNSAQDYDGVPFSQTEEEEEES